MGSTGLHLSALSYGSWVTFGKQIDLEQSSRLMHTAWDAGVNFFDNAEVYSRGQAEEIMGQVIKNAGWRRDAFAVSSKVFWGGVANPAPTQKGLSRKHVVEACHQAMQRLQVDYLDLYFCHRPDPTTPVSEVVFTMDSLIRQGKVLYWGTSEWSANQIQQAIDFAKEYRLIGPAMEQPQYNLLHRSRFEQEYAPLWNQGLGSTIWSPLASGLLTGKYNNGIPEGARLGLPGFEWLRDRLLGEGGTERLQAIAAFSSLAAELGISPARLAIAWCLAQPHVSTVILGATKVEQLQETLLAANDVPLLTPDVLQHINSVFSAVPGDLEL